MWAATHDGDFAAAETEYYASPGACRAARAIPATFIDVMHAGMVRVERL